jgi:hypothetical protein
VLRAAVLAVVAAFALSIVQTTIARSNGAPRRSAAAEAKPVVDPSLPGVEIHMHGDQVHYHVAADAPTGKLTKAERLARKARGLLMKGLRTVDRKHPCRAGYEVETEARKNVCTHGPDPAPDGVDVRQVPTATELAETAAQQAAEGAATALPCYGDGVSGPRVQAVYVHAADVTDRFAEVAGLIPQWAARVDSVFSLSARETAGTRHVRFVTNTDCTLNIAKVELSSAGDDSLDNTINELSAMGFNRSDRKYLVWADAGRYCGIGEVRNDDRGDASNSNNFGPSFARVDASCWGMGNSVEAHELMHNLGGIQMSAPHSSGGWHCIDENDRMCLADSTAGALSYPCPTTHETLFDCGHDDYFSTAPVAGSYLATHWNAANSSFLSAAMPEGCSSSSAATGSEEAKRRKHRKKHRRAHAGDASAPCVPAVAFGG